ncbi:DUF3142 domain-containing protein [Enterobacillus tribolii]|uniref:Uncharacterized protein DUF3142 n=1 Tax=Enterobacillus tribolii TaxID=1487935 RepID=A0A370QGK2_9GAMM|nr:DUF3142 domain-containing protein [Enterobacillus tribolii]RDK87429.1 uncharacterized protein DUF3142 [Enterobacillus tribolii]
MKFRCGALLALVLMTSAFCLGAWQSLCPALPAPAWQQQVYIWQRVWSDRHARALSESRTLFSALRVLAFQQHPAEGTRYAGVDLALLRADGRPVWLVARLDGQLARLDQPQLVHEVLRLAEQWRLAGVNLRGVEIDYDAATAKLGEYGRFLAALRNQLPAQLQLSITTLPAWLSSPRLAELLRIPDASVLQVHAVLSPEQGIFDSALAGRWLAAYAQRTSRPFLVALPAYGMALAQTGSALQVISEAPLRMAGEFRELTATPQALSAFVAQLTSRRYSHLSGIIWFRLPLEDDQRVWSLTTLKAVIERRPLDVAWQLSVLSQPADPDLHDLALQNGGDIDAPLPRRIVFPAQSCQAFDGARGYQAAEEDGALIFTRTDRPLLRAGERYAIGWARCARIMPGGLHVTP